jgi:hypothetical protein
MMQAPGAVSYWIMIHFYTSLQAKKVSDTNSIYQCLYFGFAKENFVFKIAHYFPQTQLF